MLGFDSQGTRYPWSNPHRKLQCHPWCCEWNFLRPKPWVPYVTVGLEDASITQHVFYSTFHSSKMFKHEHYGIFLQDFLGNGNGNSSTKTGQPFVDFPSTQAAGAGMGGQRSNCWHLKNGNGWKFWNAQLMMMMMMVVLLMMIVDCYCDTDKGIKWKEDD